MYFIFFYQRLNREKGIMARNASSMDEMRAEIYRLNKDLLSERNHCRTLEEELRVPANAHRWRALQGNDPSTYELILKIQTYQRLLIKKTDEVIQIDRMLQEKEDLYVELKTIMSKLPNQEVHERIIKMQKALQDKTKQMRVKYCTNFKLCRMEFDNTFRTKFNVDQPLHLSAQLTWLPLILESLLPTLSVNSQ